MRVAPLIHTRTFSCDFNSEFMVRPESFLDSDIKWARKYILNATGAIDSMQGERWVIVDNGKYKFAGLVGFLKNICEKCSLSEEEYAKSKSMFCDDKDRLVYAFIGVVFDRSIGFGKITYDYLWRKYLELIFPVWKKTYQEVIIKKFSEEELEPSSTSYLENAEDVGNQKLFEANPVLDYDRFEYFLSNSLSEEFSYCSNICDYNLIRQCDFTVVSTSRNIITRLKRNSPKIVEQQSMAIAENQSVGEHPTPINIADENNYKKKSLVVLVIWSLIFVIIILILLLLMGN